jgi:ubiquinone/menaquinone biosynthesis C-methylase UbiE
VQDGRCAAAYEAVFERLALGPGTPYCDVGCGAGRAALLASGRGADVSCREAAENLLEIARERVAGADFRLGDLEELPCPAGTFDVVTGFKPFQFAADPEAALREAQRISKPSGCIVVLTWGPRKAWQRQRSSARSSRCCRHRHRALPGHSPAPTTVR